MSQSIQTKYITKIEKIEIENFRGWAKYHSIDVDADVVIITGSNGRGKSSLLEALCKILNNVNVHSKEDNNSICDTKSSAHWVIKLDAKINGEKKIKKFAAEYNKSSNIYTLGSNEYLKPSMLQRSTVFIQEKLENQFEEPNTEDTLYSFLKPRPQWLDDFKRSLNDYITKIDQHRIEIANVSTIDLLSVKRKRDEYANHLVSCLSELFSISYKDQLDPLLNLVDVIGKVMNSPLIKEDNLNEELDRVKSVIRKKYTNSIEIQEQITMIDHQIDVLIEKIKNHEKKWPNLKVIADWEFGTTGMVEYLLLLENTTNILKESQDKSLLIKYLEEIPEKERIDIPYINEVLIELPKELEKVDASRVSKYRSAVSKWTAFWTDRKKEISELEDQLTQEQEKKKKLVENRYESDINKTIDALKYEQNRLRYLRVKKNYINRMIELWKKEKPVFEVLKVLEKILENNATKKLDNATENLIEKSMSSLMRHYIIAGLEDVDDPVSVKRNEESIQLVFKDKRNRKSHFSTGQTAQTALAWIIGSNALLQKWLPHRILMLDDFSTALDMTNLASECSLIRKIAYSNDSERKRQVFITCHHDQFTRKLMDYLLPPEGSKLIEIHIDKWTLKDGPEIKRWEIEPTKNTTEEIMGKLATDLSM